MRKRKIKTAPEIRVEIFIKFYNPEEVLIGAKPRKRPYLLINLLINEPV